MRGEWFHQMVGYSESIIRFCFLSFCKCNYIIDGKNEYIYIVFVNFDSLVNE